MTNDVCAGGCRWLVPFAALLLGVSAFGDAQNAPSPTLHLTYQAFIAGAKAGKAWIRVSESAKGTYAVHGTLETRGLLQRLSPWRSRFAVVGRVEEGRGVPTEFGVQEWARRKERTIHVAGGVLRQLRNGRLRPPRPAPPGTDIMSALWFGGRCEAEQVLNNGRHFYTMTRSDHVVGDDGSERCEYEIVDDDDEHFSGWVELGDRHGQRVPLEIGIDEGVTRRLTLKSATLETSADGPPWSVTAAAKAVKPPSP